MTCVRFVRNLRVERESYRAVSTSHEPSPRFRPFEITVERRDDKAVLTVAGELELASTGELEQEVRRARAAGYSVVVLDLRKVAFIDSAGLRVLLSLRNDAKRAGYTLCLVPPAPAIQRIFEITRTRGLFDWRSP